MAYGFYGSNTTAYSKKRKGSTKKKGYARTTNRRAPMFKKTRMAHTRRRVRRVAYGGTKRRRTTTVQTLAKKVTKLSKSVSQSLAVLTTRRLSTGQISAAEGKQFTVSLDLNSQGLLNDSLDALDFYDAGSNTIVSIDASDNAAGYQRDYNFKYMAAKVTLVNNRKVPVVLKAAIVIPKNDTSVTPDSAFLAGLVDIGGLAADNILTKWSDSDVFTDMWKTAAVKKVTLAPGQSLVLHYDMGSINYNVETAEADSIRYRKDEKPCALMVTLRGVHGHDSSVAGEMSTLIGSVDYQLEVVRKIEYEAGMSIKRTKITLDTFQTAGFTNTGMVGQVPVSGLQSFT